MFYNFQVFLFSFLPLLLALLFLKSYFSSPKSYKNLPPSPPRLPLIGNLHQIGAGKPRNFQSLSQTYGPLILLRYGTRPVVLASSVEAAREILKTQDITFASRPSLTVAKKLTHNYTDIAFAPYGEYWRQLKSISVLHLLSNKRVNSFRHVREEEVAKMIKQIQGDSESVVNLSESCYSVTHNVICRVVYGQIFDANKFRILTNKFAKAMNHFSFENFIPPLAWLDRFTGLYGVADEVVKDVDLFYGGMIRSREKQKKEVGVESQDLLDILFEIQRDNLTGFRLENYMIQGILQDLTFGGTDTTATNLEWAISLLIQNPHAMKELQQEARKVGQGRPMILEEDLDQMPYLKAVEKETLRLYVPNPLLVPHISTKDAKILGYDIPSGTHVIINGWAIARDPSIWDEPEKFKPERFLNTKTDYLGFDYEYIPFGAGRRMCPGIKFAVVITELALANLVYKFDFAPQDEKGLDMSESAGITLHRKLPILVKATPCE